ncbi:MAG: plasmid recombination protein [Desulfovibrio sp.]|nr:plasmid recombination protein [Desulfovibrio sp.]
MSLLVLHMNKFKKDAIRGIQSHNRRERESHSNPDINYARSAQNYDLHEAASENYAQAIQNRIDDLLMVKAVRKDAVHMCGLVVSSDREFFDKLNADETKRFFEEAAAYLTEFVGKENVISAMVHMDEKTPHMHFLHVPITKDGRLCAKDIYTKPALKKLQDELPKHLQKCGFLIERGVEQQKGSAKKHLDTREFKQQQKMLTSMRREAARLEAILFDPQEEVNHTEKERRELFEQNETWRKRISEAEESLKNGPQLPAATFFNYNDVLAHAQEKLAAYQQALPDKEEVARQRDMWARQAQTLLQERDKAREAVRLAKSMIAALEAENKKLQTRMAQAKEKAASEMKDMQDFILVSGNHLRFQEFQLQRMEEKALEARARVERERQIRQEAKRQNQAPGMRMR